MEDPFFEVVPPKPTTTTDQARMDQLFMARQAERIGFLQQQLNHTTAALAAARTAYSLLEERKHRPWIRITIQVNRGSDDQRS